MNSLWLCCVLSPWLASADPQPAVTLPPAEVVVSDFAPAVSPPVVEGATVANFSSTTAAPNPSRVGLHKNVAVVCPPALLPALVPWIEFRQEQGYQIIQVDGGLSSLDILQAIRRFARTQHLHAVVLVGDADLRMDADPAIRKHCVPTFMAVSKINPQLGSEAHIATDNPYADIDGDQTPDIPVGRLCVDTPAQLSQLVRKILAYEHLPRSEPWRCKINLAAGVGDFGLLADTLIETTAKRFLVEGIPASYRTTMTYGNWRSPYCPDPRIFREFMLRGVNEGCLFWVYMGHGRPHRLDRFRVGEAIIPVLEASDVPRFKANSGLPIAVLLACYAGAFEQPQECLAERLLQNPDGPVAVIAASRITMPYSMAILGTSLMAGAFEQRLPTIGEIYLAGKQALTTEKGGKHRKLMDSLAKTLSPTKEELPTERLEHQLIFNLLGDPLLEVDYPHPISLAAQRRVAAGENLRLHGTAPISGPCTLELVCRRDRLTFTPSRRKSPENDEQVFNEMTATYHRANDSRWLQRKFNIRAGRFVIDVPVPSLARGPSHVRLFVDNGQDFAERLRQRLPATAGRAKRIADVECGTLDCYDGGGCRIMGDGRNRDQQRTVIRTYVDE